MMTSNYDRQELIGILSALSDDRLIQALSAAGVSVSPGDMAGASDPVNELTPWNRTEVRVPMTQRKPIADLSRTFEQQPAPAMSYLNDPRMDSIAPYAGAIA